MFVDIGKWIVRKVIGTRNARLLKAMQPTVERIAELEPATEVLTDDQLRGKTEEFRARLVAGETLDDLLPEAFAVVREASRRVLGMRHYDVQMLGGMILHRGILAEMRTGEGKTLVATLPAYLNALTGRGVHIITVNDFLAQRDSVGDARYLGRGEFEAKKDLLQKGNFVSMGMLYGFLGLSVGCIVHGLDGEERQAAYGADITYGQNNEFGFDYLRDNMVTHPSQRVQRPLNYAIVDEVDSILVDEARTPLIISGPAEESTDKYYKIDRLIPQLKADEHFKLDEKTKTVALNENGIAKAEELLMQADLMQGDNLYDPANVELVHHVNQGLRAHTLFRLDRDYVVKRTDKGTEVIIVDEFTGRLMPGRRWSDGLHQAVEAKEGVKIQNENQTLATITFQNYFRMYKKLCGMTGTAETEAAEFYEIYKLDVLVVPTHRPMIREDRADVVYLSEREKFNAVLEEIKEAHEAGRPILVGTTSIEKNEKLAQLLDRGGLKGVYQILNAKQHEREADIIAKAGESGSITVATNMAGRGVDIKLGPGVAAKGGLHIVGTERHESRRIDNQLRGRAGRQGDPGSTRFFLALEDDLMRIFASERLQRLMKRLGMKEGDVIEHRMVTRAIERAQKQVEARNFDMRKHLLEYDEVMNRQRTAVYGLRNSALTGEDLKERVRNWIADTLGLSVEGAVGESDDPAEWNWEALETRLLEVLPVPADLAGARADSSRAEHLLENLTQQALAFYDRREHELGSHLVEAVRRSEPSPARLRDLEGLIGPEMLAEVVAAADPIRALTDRTDAIGSRLLRHFERMTLLQVVDSNWKDHLYAMDNLREGIGLRAYAQKDPLIEYKREGFQMFQQMTDRIKEDVVKIVFRVRGSWEDAVARQRAQAAAPSRSWKESRAPMPIPVASGVSAPDEGPGAGILARPGMPMGGPPPVSAGERMEPFKRERPKVGRNEACPCGSGKKYKKCHGVGEA